jgi:hypothetical protein
MNEWDAVLLAGGAIAGAVRLTFWARARKKKKHLKKVERILTEISRNGRSGI